MQTMRRVALPSRQVPWHADAVPGADFALVAGFLALQLFLGYEWLMSGVSKLLAGGFGAGLGATLSDMTQNQDGWYKAFIDGIVIPNGSLFGNLVMMGELALGIVPIAAAVVLLTWRRQLSPTERRSLLAIAGLAAIVGAFMSLNFHLATGATAPWVVASDPNDQGVDLDSLMVVMQLVLAGANLRQLAAIRRAV